jgi:hypothetical protein
MFNRLSVSKPLAQPVPLGPTDSLKIILTATEDGKAKRPHQAFLLLREEETGLETTFPFEVKDTGKGKVDFVRYRFPLIAKKLADTVNRHKKTSPSNSSVAPLPSKQPSSSPLSAPPHLFPRTCSTLTLFLTLTSVSLHTKNPFDMASSRRSTIFSAQILSLDPKS